MNPNEWLGKLLALHPSINKDGPAPHKPLLLLTLLDLIELGAVSDTAFTRTPELTFRFLAYWRVVAARRSQKPDIRLPLHHLSTQGFWTPQTDDGQTSRSRNTTTRAVLDRNFRDALADPGYRAAARHLLITRYFPKPEQSGMFAAAGMPVPTEDATTALEDRAVATVAERRGRQARFRLLVVAAYDYTCALTRYRLTTLDAGSLVDAAHIHQFADSRNNHPTNGLALSKNAHWMFDNGLWTVREDYSVAVAEAHFSDSHPHGLGLLSYRDTSILLPDDPALRPASEFLAWHRKKKFLGRT